MTILRSVAVALFVLAIAGCGGDGITLEGTYSVRDVNLLAKDITVGESDRAEVFFDTKTEVDGTPDGTRVVVRIDRALRYQPFSSSIYDNSTDTADARSPDQIVPCSNGSTFLVYDFSDSELFGRALGPNSRFGFRFQVVGAAVSSEAVVEAAAGKDEGFACDSSFQSEQNEIIRIG